MFIECNTAMRTAILWIVGAVGTGACSGLANNPSPAPASPGEMRGAVRPGASVADSVPKAKPNNTKWLTLASAPVSEISADVYGVGSDGRSTKQLTELGIWNINRVVFSPDGAQVVFDAVEGVHGKLFVMKANGSALHEIRTGRDSFLPSFGVRGRTIIYTGVDPDGRVSVSTVTLDGGVSKLIATDATEGVVSHDGRFVAYCDASGLVSHLIVGSIDGPKRRPVPGITGCRRPRFNPRDPGEVLLTTLNPAAIHLIRTDTGRDTVLVTGKGVTWEADFSPSGKAVAYTDLLDQAAPSLLASPSEIYEYSRVTKTSRRLTSSDVSLNFIEPSYSPDGHRLVFIGIRKLNRTTGSGKGDLRVSGALATLVPERHAENSNLRATAGAAGPGLAAGSAGRALSASTLRILGGTVAGAWDAGDFTFVNAFCRQGWTCDRPPGVYPDGCASTATAYTSGTCSADGGPPDGCNSCIAPKPTQPCETICP
jgi:hypothetical protein